MHPLRSCLVKRTLNLCNYYINFYPVEQVKV
ncbi:hypothetical protein VPHD51_0086 [Vibrio phage D51]